jgi:hypothetical protein
MAFLSVVMAGGLLACSLSGAQPTAEIILEPTVRPAASSPPPTSAPPPPTSAPAPTESAPLASSVYRDEFNGVFDPVWGWSQSGFSGYSLSHMAGWLRINLSTGSFLHATPPDNLLLRPAPAGDFSIQTLLRFSPHNNFELAGLVVVFDDGSALQFGRGFCYTDGNSANCIGDGLYFDNIQNGAAVGGNFATPALLGLDYVLRLERQGTTYAVSDSTDGTSWTPLGSHTVAAPPVSIGLIAAQATVANPYADFDYFEISE